MKNDAKFEEELTCQFKIAKRNLTNFDSAREISPNLYFDRLLLLKVCNILAKKVQRSYAS